MSSKYRSSIPRKAHERILERYPNGRKKKAEYKIANEIVGIRYFHETGEPDFEYALKNGKKHGIQYRWDNPGKLLSGEPYFKGVPHGTARQWSYDGHLIGMYTLVHGTGIDLWRREREDGTVYLAEVYYLKDGAGHGFEWWIKEDQKSVYIESHYQNGVPHGIWREWNSQGRLRRGFPQYYISGDQVTKQRYMKACDFDPSLPRFQIEDNDPSRHFPPEIARQMNSA